MARAMKDSGIEWIGEIPEEWSTIKFKYIFGIIGGNGFPEFLQGKNEGKYPFCKVSDINGTSDYVDCAVNYVTEEVAQSQGFSIIPKGSIIIAKIGAALQKNHRKINTVPCCIDNNTQALIPMRNDEIRYLLYLTKAIDMRWFDNNSTVPSINNIRLLNFSVPNPSLSEQRRIAAFLDAKCAEIDSVIANTKATIEDYKKLKQSIITEAVTKGVRGARKMKDSGIEWIGEIPEEWECIRNVFLFRENVRLPRKDAIPLSLSQVDGLIATDDMKESSLKTSTYEGWKQVELNDLVLNRFKGHLGVLYSATLEGMVSFHYGVYEPLLPFDSKFFEYLYHSNVYKAILGLKSNGMTIGLQNLSNANFYSVYSLYPPIEEQQEIITYLDTKCAEIDRLIASKHHLLSELESYKKSVIYETVTGKREIG